MSAPANYKQESERRMSKDILESIREFVSGKITGEPNATWAPDHFTYGEGYVRALEEVIDYLDMRIADKARQKKGFLSLHKDKPC